MNKMDVTGSIKPAFQHMIQMLFKPFSWKKWLALGFVTLFMGSGGGNGGKHFNSPGTDQWGKDPQVAQWLAHFWPLLILLAILLIGLGLLLTWIASVFHFVFIDDVAKNSGAVKEPFARLKGAGTSLFLWQLGFGVILFFLIILGLGAPLAVAFSISCDIGALQICAIIWAILFLIAIIIVGVIIQRLVIDFVTMAMYKCEIGILKAWKEIMPILKANAGQILLYFLLTLAINIAATIPILLIMGLVLLIFAIPFGGLGAIGFFIGKAAGLTWTAPVIAVVCVYGFIVLTTFIYALSCATLPVPVFMRSYSMLLIGQADPGLATIGAQIPVQPQPDVTGNAEAPA